MYRWDEIFNKKKSSKVGTVDFFKEISFEPNFKIINVVGTNGKGSVSNYISQHISHNNYKVGLFTSPHLIFPNERIKIDGNNISDSEYWSIYSEHKSKFEKHKLGFFQIMYVIACIWFNKNNCKFVIMEAGIGGRYDPTNIFNGLFGVVTSISYDHCDMLGEELKDIAWQKAGIINAGMKFFIPTSLDGKLIDIFIHECNIKGASYELIDCDGHYRDRNMKLAQEVGKKITGISCQNFIHPLGRSQLINWKDKLLTIDVGHNLEALENSWEIICDEYDLIIFYSKRQAQQLKDMQDFLKSKAQMVTLNKEEQLPKIFDLMKNKKRILLIGSHILVGYFLKEARDVY